MNDEMTAWVQAEDAVLGSIPEPAPDGVATFSSASRRASGVARVVRTPADSHLALWSATTVDLLQLRLRAAAGTADVAEVLDAWLATPAAAVEHEGGDHARTLRLPVVARQAIVPLLDRGFAPATSTLVRRTRGEDDSATAPPPSGITIRQAVPGDRAAMVTLTRELIATEAEFGAVRERAAGVSDYYVDDVLSLPAGWVMVAEADGVPVGWASLAPPEQSSWAAASVSVAPASYLGIATVTRAERSRGVGRALAVALHRQAARAGVAVTLLDASVLNPWSMPFWYRQGYRPIWTTWHRRTSAA